MIPRHNKYVLSLIKTHFNGILTGAEIGVYQGQLSEYLLKAIPNLYLFMIDPWKGFQNERSILTDEEMNSAKLYAIDRTNFADSRRMILQKTSEEAAKHVRTELDFVFIDGNHSTPSVLQDMINWTPKVVDGGLVIGHDYDLQSVKIAVRNFCGEHKIKFNVIRDGRMWWFIK